MTVRDAAPTITMRKTRARRHSPITVRAGPGSQDAAPKETMMADNGMNPATPDGMNLGEWPAPRPRRQAAFPLELPVDDVRAIARKLAEQAREGARTSARLVLKYGLGTALAEAKRPPKPAQDADFLAT